MKYLDLFLVNVHRRMERAKEIETKRRENMCDSVIYIMIRFVLV